MRLFVGIPIPEPVQERLLALSGGIPGARWVDPANYHITLRFLGDTERQQAEDLVEALSRIEVPEVLIRIRGVGLFGDRRRQQQLYADIMAEPNLSRLNQKVEQVAQRVGYEPEGRRFHPHVTIARMRNPDRTRLQHFLIDRGDLMVPDFTVGGFHLYESHLHTDGAIYTPIADFGDLDIMTGRERP